MDEGVGGLNQLEFDELKMEVKQFLAEGEIMTPRPILRIGQLITAIRRYKASIVAANAPIDFQVESAQQQELLRQHRLSKLNELREQREWLLKLNTEWIINGEPWRTQDAHWQANVWTPLNRWVKAGFALMFDDMESRDRPEAHSLAVLNSWESDELSIEFQLLLRICDFQPESEWPVVDFDRGTLSWAERVSEFSDRELKVLGLLIQSKGDYVRKTALCEAAGDSLMEDEAFRKMFSRLKKKLAAAGFPGIAESIIQSPGGRTRLDHNRLLQSLISEQPKDVT